MRQALASARAHPGAVLASLTVLLLPFGRLVEGPVLLMAALGLWQLARSPRKTLTQPAARALTAIFLCAWIPVLISLPDAVDPKSGVVISINHLRFWLSGLFLVQALSQEPARRFFLDVCAGLIGFWVVDALIQYFTGTDLFGYEAWPNRLGALFGPDNSKFGLTLAVFAPLLWHVCGRRFGRPGAAIALGLSITVVFLAFSRAGWVTVLVAASTWLFLRATMARAPAPRTALLILMVMGAGALTAYTVSDMVRGGVDQALSAFDDDADHHNSIVHRIWIWGAALRMIQAHPVNGVGARGFRHAFPAFARPDDPYLKMDPPQYPTHSHQLLIEVTAETGLIGLAGLIVLWLLLIRIYRHAPPDSRVPLAALGAALAGAYFPLNTHLAIYSAYWSQITWFLIGIYCALSSPSPSDSSTSRNASRIRSAENQRS